MIICFCCGLLYVRSIKIYTSDRFKIIYESLLNQFKLVRFKIFKKLTKNTNSVFYNITSYIIHNKIMNQFIRNPN